MKVDGDYTYDICGKSFETNVDIAGHMAGHKRSITPNHLIEELRRIAGQKGRRARRHDRRPSDRVRSGLSLQSGEWVTQSDVAETGNVTPMTVRTHYETLEEQVA
ncbi:hypothetical protein SAMN05216277_11314 [Halolamina pelagica]|uniref:C2H2-type domain-containing protein n=1 Tax=Halolamina pelagica TaxID=699431 RepID=A0A1I5UJT9_9EURY|nr:hypothetical protein SAMN05216277_11314 [Halolamina pelagica]